MFRSKSKLFIIKDFISIDIVNTLVKYKSLKNKVEETLGDNSRRIIWSWIDVGVM